MSRWIDVDFRWSSQTKVLVRVGGVRDSGGVETGSSGVEVTTLYFNSTIFRVIQGADHDWSGTEELDNLDHLLVGGETNTNMGVVFVCDLAHLFLEFKQ